MEQSYSEEIPFVSPRDPLSSTEPQDPTAFRSLLLIVSDPQRAQQLQHALKDFLFGDTPTLSYHARTGREGLLFLRNIHPDCVVLDDALSDMSGAMWLSTLSPLGLHASFPIVYLHQQPSPPLLQAFCYQQLHLSQFTAMRFQNSLQAVFRQWQSLSPLSFSKIPYLHLPRPFDSTPQIAQGVPSVAQSNPSLEELDAFSPEDWPVSLNPTKIDFKEPSKPSNASNLVSANHGSANHGSANLSSVNLGSADLSAQSPLADQWRKNLENSRAGLWYWRPSNEPIVTPHEDFPIGHALQTYFPRLHPHDALRLQEDLLAYHQKENPQELFSSTVRARPFDRLDSEETPQWHWFLCRGNLQKVPWSPKPEVWGFFVDVTSFKEEEERLAYLASHDPLTGLANRALFMDRLQQTLERMNRRPENPLALLFLDCDRFKSVNDIHGHTTGDLLLQQIARRISRTLRAVDTIARFGGDEFVILLDNTPHLDRARLVAERLRQEMHEPFVLDGVTLEISTSIGLLWHTTPGYSASQLLDQADQAMYKAKHEGGDRFAVMYSGNETI